MSMARWDSGFPAALFKKVISVSVCVRPWEMGCSPGKSLWVFSLAAAFLLCLPCASPAPVSQPLMAFGGKRKALVPQLWDGQVLSSSAALLRISRDLISAKVSVGPTSADFSIPMSVDYSSRIMCLKKDYLAGSCLPNISLEQVFTAELQWPDSSVYDRNSASYLMPGTRWLLSHWKTLLSE